MRKDGYLIKDIANELGISYFYVAKIIEELSKDGYVQPIKLDVGPSYILG